MMSRRFTILPGFAPLFSLIACLALCSAQAFAQNQAQPVLAMAEVASPAVELPASRPKVALVLSGGGARGIAHIGVLRVLRELRVPVDMVVGTSMGAVVGGAYAAGRSVDELERIVSTTPWDEVLADRPARDELNFRRREEDLQLPSRIEFGVTRDGVSLPPAAAGNAGLERALARLLPADMYDRPVNRLPLPFRSAASDLVTGEVVELNDVSLFLAMRASLSLPGVFMPVRVKNHLVVDGGLVRNLPVDMARAMGADIIIAVNVGTPLAPERELGSAISVANQMLQILTEQNVQRSLRELRPADILISPNLEGINFLDFNSFKRTMRAGEHAAEAATERLRALALPQEIYASLEESRTRSKFAPPEALPIGRITVKGTEDINPASLIEQTGLVPGVPATQTQIREAATRLYGRGDLAYVETEIEEVDGRNDVTIRPVESTWGRHRIRVGIELASDLSDANDFNFGFMHVASSLNRWGAEARSVLRVGSRRQLGIQLMQPLGPGSPWYVQPEIEYGGTTTDLFNEGRRAYRVGVNTAGASLALGRHLGNWGDIQLGVQRQRGQVDLLVPEDPAQPTIRSYETNRFAELRIDTLDSLAFPARGHLFVLRGERSGGSRDTSLARSSLTLLQTIPAGTWAGHVRMDWARAASGTAPLSLGGFLRLSGAPANSIVGDTVLYSHLVMARQIGEFSSAMSATVRAGFSLEAGGAFGRNDPIRGGALKHAASAFLSVDTRFGPAFVGVGSTRGIGNSFYLFLGPIW